MSTILAELPSISLPVHLLDRGSVGWRRSSLAALLGCVRPVAGDVKIEDDGVVLQQIFP